jgi:hypothetical protein
MKDKDPIVEMLQEIKVMILILFIKTASVKNKKFWFSIKRAKDCLFSRRLGFRGKIIFGYSVRLRVFNFDVI